MRVAYHESTVLLFQVNSRATWMEVVRVQNLGPGPAESLDSLREIIFLQPGVGNSGTPPVSDATCHAGNAGGYGDNAARGRHTLEQFNHYILGGDTLWNSSVITCQGATHSGTVQSLHARGRHTLEQFNHYMPGGDTLWNSSIITS